MRGAAPLSAAAAANILKNTAENEKNEINGAAIIFFMFKIIAFAYILKYN